MKECVHRTGPISIKVQRHGVAASEMFFRCSLAEAQTGVRHGFPAAVCAECEKSDAFGTGESPAVQAMVDRVLYNKVIRHGIRA